jgi:predicted Ser/Thr protein kinase
MQLDTMPTLESRSNPDSGAPTEHGEQRGTHHGGREPFDERFRRANLREEMFGEPGENLYIGRFRVVARLGSGGMGVVYLAVDEQLERKVAVKLLRLEDEIGGERMQREAKALAKLSHPNVVTVHEVGTHEGQVFVAMEYVEGSTLKQWLVQKPPTAHIVSVFCQAAMGLQSAHDAGIVHRDFKPENVLVGEDGRVRVLDFGLARPPGKALTGEVVDPHQVLDLSQPTLTRTGMFAGTPAYMAPEQFAGTPVDARTDQFAFCIALHEALYGQRPFQGATLAELAAAVIEGDVTTTSGRRIPQHVDTAIQRGLSREPDRRFRSMTELSGVLSGNVAAAPPTRLITGVIGGLLGFLFLTLIGGVAVYMVLAPAPNTDGTDQFVEEPKAVAPVAPAEVSPASVPTPGVSKPAIRRRIPGLKRCIEADPDAEQGLAKIVYTVTVAPEGTVSDLRVDEDGLESQGVLACTKEEILSWRFEPGPEEQEVTFSVVFGGTEDED